jgi:hypothetical protein
MTNIADKVKEKLKDAKDKVANTTKEGAEATKEEMTEAKDKVTSSTNETIGRDVSLFLLMLVDKPVNLKKEVLVQRLAERTTH